MKKKATKKKVHLKTDTTDKVVEKTVEEHFGARDRVIVNYRTKWFDIINVNAIILRANRNSGYPYKVQLENKDGTPANCGHDDDGGSPGSGPFMYCRAEELTMVDKFVPKRLEGVVKTDWKVGDKFIPKADFSTVQDEEDDRTGVTQRMVDSTAGKEFTITAIISRCGADWLLDGADNYVWLSAWIDPSASE